MINALLISSHKMKRKWNQCFAIFNWSVMSKLITIKSISICSWLMCTDSTLSYFCDSRLTVIIRRGFSMASDKLMEGAEQTPWMDWKTPELWSLKEEKEKQKSHLTSAGSLISLCQNKISLPQKEKPCFLKNPSCQTNDFPIGRRMYYSSVFQTPYPTYNTQFMTT